MTSNYWDKMEEIYHSAIKRAGSEREVYLREACAGDEPLEKEVRSLLFAHENAGGFLERSAFEIGMRVLGDSQLLALREGSIGHYQVLSRLGEGGMGAVYLAHDQRLGRKVALKILHLHYADDREQLRQEARAASIISHPNVAHVYEVGEADGYTYIAMEFVEGVTLRTAIADKRMEVKDAVDLLLQVAAALGAAHAVGVVHRDIKPENIMVRHDGYVKVLDFGLAKTTRHQVLPVRGTDGRSVGDSGDGKSEDGKGAIMGTVSYMSPEQLCGCEVDQRSDIYANQ